MASSPDVIAVILLVFSLGQLKLVQPNPIEDCRAELAQRLVGLDAAFENLMERTFYEKLDEARESSNLVMALIVAEIARFDLLQHRRERKALMIADDIIANHLITEASGPDDWPPRTASFANLTIARSIERACEAELDGEQFFRKRIYTFFDTYDNEEPIQELAFDYSLRVRDKHPRALKAQELMTNALERFRRDVTDRYSDAKVSNVLRSIDELIVAAESRLGPSNEVEVNKQIFLDIKVARRIPGHPISTERAIANVTMDEVAAYSEEYSLAEGILQSIDEEVQTLEEEFKDIAPRFLAEPARVASADPAGQLDHPLLALSARLAEAECLIFVAVKKMSSIARDIISQYVIERSNEFEDPLIENSNLINLIWQRSLQHGYDYGLLQTVKLRKEIHIFLNTFQEHAYLKKLIRKFHSNLYERKRAFRRANLISSHYLDRYKEDVLFVLSDAQMQDTLRAVDKLITETSIAEGGPILQTVFSDEERESVLRQAAGQTLFNAMMTAKTQYELNQEEVESLDMGEVIAVEDEYHSDDE